MTGLYVVRNQYNEYLQVDLDTDVQDWVEYDEATWLEDFDADYYNEGRYEVVEVE